MTTKIYAVYSIPKSPEYHLEGLFETKEYAKNYIKNKKEQRNFVGSFCNTCNKDTIYDIQIEEIKK
jgi:ribosomal protein L34E